MLHNKLKNMKNHVYLANELLHLELIYLRRRVRCNPSWLSMVKNGRQKLNAKHMGRLHSAIVDELDELNKLSDSTNDPLLRNLCDAIVAFVESKL